MEIFGIILALIIGGFLVETFRVPRIEKWSHHNGFIRLNNISEEIISQLQQFVEIFGRYSVTKFGFSMSRTCSAITVTIAEHYMYLDSEKTNWFTLVALVKPNSKIPEFRMESRNEIAADFNKIIEILLYPLKYLSRQRDWKWIKHQLTPVDFSEDIPFDNAFRVFGDMLAAKRALDPVMRAALVRHQWRGQLVVSGDTVVWRRKGTLWPSRLKRVLTEVDLFSEILLKF